MWTAKACHLIAQAKLAGPSPTTDHQAEEPQEQQQPAKGLDWVMIGDGPWQRVNQPDGSVYYYNQSTQESTWALPEGVVDDTVATTQPAMVQPADQPQETPVDSNDWELVQPEDGSRPYYHHRATGETAWEKPALSVEEEFEIPELEFDDEPDHIEELPGEAEEGASGGGQ